MDHPRRRKLSGVILFILGASVPSWASRYPISADRFSFRFHFLETFADRLLNKLDLSDAERGGRVPGLLEDRRRYSEVKTLFSSAIRLLCSRRCRCR